MERFGVKKELLGFVFKRLRVQEGLKDRVVTAHLNEEQIFKIIANVKFKQDKGMIYTDLEKAVLRENGNYIKMYVFQKYDETTKVEKLNQLPFEEYKNVTLKELNEDVKKKNAKSFLVNQIA